MAMTVKVETTGATAGLEIPQVETAVLSINTSQTARTEPVVALKAAHLTR
jgi:hypothetical protein